MKAVYWTSILLVIAGSGAAYYATHAGTRSITSFHTTEIKRGDLLSTINATGTIEPEEVVNVGAQVMGLILEFGSDPRNPDKAIDYGSVVEKGTVLAKIDPTPYEGAVEQAEAAYQGSLAGLLQFKAKLLQTEQDRKRAEALRTIMDIPGTNRPIKGIADSDYDQAVANHEMAKANVAVGEAAVARDKAALRIVKTNLGYTTITSPIRGVILDRRVNIGQTVVASLNAPSLFLIAKDLSKMQAWASVNEADIGRIQLDMPVRFTVDAHPDQTFRGKVTQIRLNAQMTQNVVTYTVIVTTDNSSGKLLPYLTANLQFEVDQRSDVLLAPNAALRWMPSTEQIDPTVNKASIVPELASAQHRGYLWFLSRSGFVRPLEVTIGVSDGTMTEISGSDVKEGMKVIAGEEGDEEVDVKETAADGDKTSNPFLPKPPKGSKPPPGPM
ncbi:MAG: efflux RND transporter periplasmic adaptor subunit [Thermoguttaceae bacterium]|jgi:HlyD family secretion protein